MKISSGIIWVAALLMIPVTMMHAQSVRGELNKVWELTSVEYFSETGALAEEMKVLDMRSDSLLILQYEGYHESVPYEVIDHEIRLYDAQGNHVGRDMILQIEALTDKALTLLFLEREDNKKIATLKYHVK